jgi:hypothetical protein
MSGTRVGAAVAGDVAHAVGEGEEVVAGCEVGDAGVLMVLHGITWDRFLSCKDWMVDLAE